MRFRPPDLAFVTTAAPALFTLAITDIGVACGHEVTVEEQDGGIMVAVLRQDLRVHSMK